MPRFILSYRYVEDLLAERGLDIHLTRAYGAGSSSLVRRLPETGATMRPIPNGSWHLDEMVIVIRGQTLYGYGLRSTIKARSWIFLQAIEAELPSSVEVDAQAAQETRIETHPDHNRETQVLSRRHSNPRPDGSTHRQ